MSEESSNKDFAETGRFNRNLELPPSRKDSPPKELETSPAEEVDTIVEGTINIIGLFKKSIIYGNDKIKYNGDLVCTEETSLKVILDSCINDSIIPNNQRLSTSTPG